MAWSKGLQAQAPAPHELLDDGFAPEPCGLLVIGCGNILRGDDAVGPVLIRHLFTRNVPDGVRLVDGGTAGMDVAFGMRGAERVVIVDASATGAAPGTVYRVPAEELSELPPIDGLHTHNFRWDHALTFSAWLLGPLKPTDITVFLVEAGQLEPGSELSAPVAAGMEMVMEIIESEFYPTPLVERGAGLLVEEGAHPGLLVEEGAHPGLLVEEGALRPSRNHVEINEAGYLHIPAHLASQHFPGDACVARIAKDEAGEEVLVLLPLISAAHGGLVLKQRNVVGDRSLLVNEVLGFTAIAGRFEVSWDDAQGALLVRLRGTAHQTDLNGTRDGAADGESAGIRSANRSGGRAGPLGGLSTDPHPTGLRSSPPGDLLHRNESPTSGRRDSTYGGQATQSQGGF